MRLGLRTNSCVCRFSLKVYLNLIKSDSETLKIVRSERSIILENIKYTVQAGMAH